MTKSKKGSRKPSVKVKDLRSKKNPQGGKKSGKSEYYQVKMEEVLVSSYLVDKTGAPGIKSDLTYDYAANKKV